jgi:hypothetical protein
MFIKKGALALALSANMALAGIKDYRLTVDDTTSMHNEQFAIASDDLLVDELRLPAIEYFEANVNLSYTDSLGELYHTLKLMDKDSTLARSTSWALQSTLSPRTWDYLKPDLPPIFRRRAY